MPVTANVWRKDIRQGVRPPSVGSMAKYKSPQKGSGNHAALAIGFSHLAITFATDLVDHRNGWACSFHSATNAIKRSARCFLSAKSAICNRFRCKIENHCSTWFIQEQCTGGKWN